MKTCTIENCHNKHQARGWCKIHYEKWRLNGDPLLWKKKPNGQGHIMESGRNRFMIKGRVRMLYQLVAEKALGKELPKDAMVHHFDENPGHDSGNNLVICQNAAYHKLLHLRTDAIKNGKPANFRKCRFCKRYDDPENLKICKAGVHHKECMNQYYRKKRK